VFVPLGFAGFHVALLGLRRAAGHVCVCACQRSLGHLVAGATWTRVIASAPWAAREGHTSVVDAAGAIYVIGGYNRNTGYLNDVWKSTVGGAGGRVLEGY
jgi:hypothetical protein